MLPIICIGNITFDFVNGLGFYQLNQISNPIIINRRYHLEIVIGQHNISAAGLYNKNEQCYVSVHVVSSYSYILSASSACHSADPIME